MAVVEDCRDGLFTANSEINFLRATLSKVLSRGKKPQSFVVTELFAKRRTHRQHAESHDEIQNTL